MRRVIEIRAVVDPRYHEIRGFDSPKAFMNFHDDFVVGIEVKTLDTDRFGRKSVKEVGMKAGYVNLDSMSSCRDV